VIVVDASILTELLATSEASSVIGARVLAPGLALHAPHLVDVEVAHALRRLVAVGDLTAGQGLEAISMMSRLEIARHPHNELLDRIWALRGNLTAYDAAYVALAEVLDAPLVTRDAELAAAPGHRAFIELF
jgi:predicted nucleic acid-binding protein